MLVGKTKKLAAKRANLADGFYAETAAFLIPCLSKLMGMTKKLTTKRANLANSFNAATDSIRAEPLILVVAPTREISSQVFDEARRLSYRSMLRPCLAYGGDPLLERWLSWPNGVTFSSPFLVGSLTSCFVRMACICHESASRSSMRQDHGMWRHQRRC